MDVFIQLIKWVFTSLIVGGGIWKGLDSVANALRARAEAVNNDRRLDFDQMQANYQNAMMLIEKQAERIDALHKDITDVEQRWDKNEMKYLERIRQLESEIKQLMKDYKELQEQYHKLECDYERALDRIVKLEKSDTGPLSESKVNDGQ